MNNAKYWKNRLRTIIKKAILDRIKLATNITKFSFSLMAQFKFRVIRNFLRRIAGVSIVLIITTGLTSCSNMSQVSKNRTPGTYIDDWVLDLAVAERTIRKSDEKFKGSHIVIEVFNGNVLIVGQVPSIELKRKATTELKKLKNISDEKIHNYLQIAPPTTLLARANDTFITTKVKAKLFASGLSPKNESSKPKVKVLTEDGIVYLMGLIEKKDSENVTSTVKSVYGVRRIVKLFNELN